MREERAKTIFEGIIAENVPNLMKSINLQIQEAQKNLGTISTKISTPIHIIVKPLNTEDKEKNIESHQEQK